MLKLNHLTGFGSGVSGAVASVSGYFGGGSSYGVGRVTNVDQITYATSTTAANTDAVLTVVNAYHASLSDCALAMYTAGGHTGARILTAEKLVYATDTSEAVTDANLTTETSDHASISDGSTNGYFSGGARAAGPTDEVEKLVFSTEVSAVNTDAVLNVSREECAGLSEGTTHGYTLTGSGSTTAEKLTFSTDDHAYATDADAPHVHSINATGMSDGIDGYQIGGYAGASYSDKAYKIVLATDVRTAETDANLSVGRNAPTGTSDGSTNAYIGGGSSAASSHDLTMDMLVFATSTTAAETDANMTYGGYAARAASDFNP